MGQIDIDPLRRAGKDRAVVEGKSGFQGKGSQLPGKPLQAVVPIDELSPETEAGGVLGIDPGADSEDQGKTRLSCNFLHLPIIGPLRVGEERRGPFGAVLNEGLGAICLSADAGLIGDPALTRLPLGEIDMGEPTGHHLHPFLAPRHFSDRAGLVFSGSLTTVPGGGLKS